MDYIRGQGNAGIGARLRRISDRIDREARAVYAHAGIECEQRWMGILMLLAERESMTVAELSRALAITQPSVSQSLRSLQLKGIIAERRDRSDGRRKIQVLTKKGRRYIDRIKPVWSALIAAARELELEQIDLLTPLGQLEDALDRRGLYERAISYMDRTARADEALPARPARRT